MSRRLDVEMVFHAHDIVGESPVWDAARACLWWVDIIGRKVRRVALSTGEAANFDTVSYPGALALSRDGSLVVALGTGWARLDPENEVVVPIAQAPAAAEGWRLNDGVVDAVGRFWTGSVDEPKGTGAGGKLFCLDGERATQVLDGLLTQNGTAISPDGATFYLSDSHPSRRIIWAFDFDLDSGSLSNRRVFHNVEHGRPDGAAIDSDGCYWFAAIDAGQIVRLDPAGKPMRVVDLPVSRPTNLAFGGDDLSTLYVTTMSLGLERGALAAQPWAGALLKMDVDVAGWPQPHAKLSARNERAEEDLSMLI